MDESSKPREKLVKDEPAFKDLLGKFLKSGLEEPVSLPRFIVQEEIGRGAMGVVYRAFDEELERNVAVKILSHDWLEKRESSAAQEINRLRSESRACAQLQHPNVVTVFRFIELDEHWRNVLVVDSQFQFESDPSACIIMSYVEGEPLGNVLQSTVPDCPESRTHSIRNSLFDLELDEDPAANEGDTKSEGEPNPLESLGTSGNESVESASFVRKVAKIGVQLASALRHSHECQVLHRDIKPSNILINEEGHVWLTDFGVARLDLSSGCNVAGSPAFMAPEAFDMSQDQRSDIFSLGATLFYLLTFEYLYQGKTKDDIREEATNYKAPRIRDFNKAIPRDFTAIIEKAIHKQPDSRYRNCEALEADLSAFLNGHPVTANPVGALGQLYRWSKNNLLATAGIAAAVCFFAIGAIGITTQSLKAESQAKLAADNAIQARDATIAEAVALKRSEDVLQVITDSFQEGDPSKGGSALASIKDVMVSAKTRAVASELDDEGKAKLFDALTVIFLGLGEYELAAETAKDDIEIRSKYHEPGDPELLGAKNNLGIALTRAGNFKEAVTVLEETHQYRIDALGMDHPLTLRTKNNLGTAYYRAGQNKKAIQCFESLIEPMRVAIGEDDPDFVILHNNLAAIYRRYDRLEEALDLMKVVISGYTKAFGSGNAKTLNARANAALMLKESGKLEEASREIKDVVKLQLEILEPDHPSVLSSQRQLASNLADLGEHAEAQLIYEEVLEISKAKLGETHPGTLATMNNLAHLLKSQQKWDRATKIAEEMRSGFVARFGPDHVNTMTALFNLAECYGNAGRRGDAIEIYEKVLRRLQEDLGAGHRNVITTAKTLAKVYHEEKRFDSAVAMYQGLLDQVEDPRKRDDLESNLMLTYERGGMRDEFEEMASELLSRGRLKYRDEPFQRFQFLLNFAKAFERVKNYKKARALVEEGLETCVEHDLSEHLVHVANSRLGLILLRFNDSELAYENLVSGFEGLVTNQKVKPKLVIEAVDRLIIFSKETGNKERLEKWQARRRGPKSPL